MVPKTSKKTKEPKAPKEPKTGPHHRAAKLSNARDLVCPECWTAPPTIRKDGVTLARHQTPDGKTCVGQGRIARHVVDDPWEIGTKPEIYISALEFIEYGTSKIEKRQAEAEAKAKRAEERAKAPKEPKTPKPKAAKPKADAKPAKPRSRKPKAKPEANGSTGSPESAVTEPPAAA